MFSRISKLEIRIKIESVQRMRKEKKIGWVHIVKYIMIILTRKRR